jgi:AraC family transcriptional regulator of adaptative response / methylphosphotriester-DNA alkyltransferase methyltransferase
MLADISHGSPYYLHRTFKKVKGIIPRKYIQKVRINTVKNHLIHTDRSIAVIAMSVGMLNTPYFITLLKGSFLFRKQPFKKKIGHTPAQYRQLNKIDKMEGTNSEIKK